MDISNTERYVLVTIPLYIGTSSKLNIYTYLLMKNKGLLAKSCWFGKNSKLTMIGIIYENSYAGYGRMEHLEHELDMYQVALGIEEPWYVSFRELDASASTLHVGLNFIRGDEFACPNCGKSCKVFDVVDEDRTWRHLNFWQFETILHARIPRVKCGVCVKVLPVKLDWARPQAGLTWRFEAYVMQLMKEIPVAALLLVK